MKKSPDVVPKTAANNVDLESLQDGEYNNDLFDFLHTHQRKSTKIAFAALIDRAHRVCTDDTDETDYDSPETLRARLSMVSNHLTKTHRTQMAVAGSQSALQTSTAQPITEVSQPGTQETQPGTAGTEQTASSGNPLSKVFRSIGGTIRRTSRGGTNV